MERIGIYVPVEDLALLDEELAEVGLLPPALLRLQEQVRALLEWRRS